MIKLCMCKDCKFMRANCKIYKIKSKNIPEVPGKLVCLGIDHKIKGKSKKDSSI